MKKIGLLLLVFLLVSCAGSSAVLITRQVTKKPYKVNVLYTADKGALNSYEMSKFNATDLLSSLIHSFDKDDQANLKKSIIASLEKSSPFDNMVFVNNEAELKTNPAEFELILIYLGSSVSTGGNPGCKIAIGIIIKDVKNEKEIYNNVSMVEEKSMWSLGKAKSNAIENTILNIFKAIEVIK